LVAPASRQILEVMARAGALVDLIATGARLVEPDTRLIQGNLYSPPGDGLSLRTFDSEPGARGSTGSAVASADTVAYSVACGHVGDPRSFKRPVRVTVPRNLPTDDVLLLRRGKAKPRGRQEADPERELPSLPSRLRWRKATTLQATRTTHQLSEPSLVIVESLDELRWTVQHAPDLLPHLCAVAAVHIPAQSVTLLSSCGILALYADEIAMSCLRRSANVDLPATDRWADDGVIQASADASRVILRWLAVGTERDALLLHG
jgi:aconitate hydratase